jgi:hypothetical protein
MDPIEPPSDLRPAPRATTSRALRLNFLIIGAEKAGTTFLHQMLLAHGDVYMPPGEIPFFEDPDYHAPGAAAMFARMFEPGGDKRVVGLKRPNYLHKPECPARIREHCPDAKLVVMLRDPVERAISAYYHRVLYRFAPLRHANWGIPAILAGRLQGRYPRSREVVDFGFYHRELQRYLDLFPRRQILITLFEDLCADPEFVQTQVLQFLGLDVSRQPRLPAGKINEGEYALRRLALLRLKGSLLYDYTDGGTRLRPRQSVGRAARWALTCIGGLDRKLQALLTGHKGESACLEVRRGLAERYIDDVRQLENLLDVDLSSWCTKKLMA